ncbi:MAG TPA: PAS domain-containing protein [Rhodothermales bacterium]|nr:PAS domain-containing protein [Rhodothermales bacterium]
MLYHDHDVSPPSRKLRDAAETLENAAASPADSDEPEVTIVLAEDGSIQDASASVFKTLGYTPALLAGKPVFRLVYEHDLLNMFRSVSNLVTGRVSEANLDVRLRTAEGRWRVFRASASVHLNGSGAGEILLVLYPVLSALAG